MPVPRSAPRKVVRSGLVVGALCGLAASVVLAACGSSDAQNIAAGGTCFSASDCAPGLVCVPVKNSDSRLCSGDLTGLTGNPEDMPDGSMREASVLDSPGFDGPVGDTSTTDTSPADTGPKDTGADSG